MMVFRRTMILVMVVFALIFGGEAIRADKIGAAHFSPQNAPTPTPKPPELVKAELDAALKKQAEEAAKSEAAAAKAKMEAARYQLGLSEASAPKATAPKGEISAGDGKFIETQILAEAAARRASRTLADRVDCSVPDIPNPPPVPKDCFKFSKLVIGNDMDVASVHNYKAFAAQIDSLTTEYNRIICENSKNLDPNSSCVTPTATASSLAAVLPSLTFASESVKAVADLLNLFRTDTEYKNEEVAIDAQMIATFVAERLLSKETKQIKDVYYPALYMPLPADLTNSSLHKAIETLQGRKTEGESLVTRNGAKITAEKAELAQEEAKPMPNANNITNLKLSINGTEVKNASLQAANASVGEFLKLVTTSVNNNEKLSALAALLRAEKLSQIIGQAETGVLLLNVASAGTTRVRKNIFWNPVPDHTGGATIHAQLFDHEGKFRGAYNVDCYVDYTKPKAIRESFFYKKLKDLKE